MRKQFWGFGGGKRNKKKAMPRRAPGLSVEALEDRTLPAVTPALLAGGVLDIGFSAGNDTATGSFQLTAATPAP